MKKILIPALLSLLIVSCRHSTQNPADKSTDQITYLKLDLLEGEGKIIYLQKIGSEKAEITDSIRLEKDGRLTVPLEVHGPQFYSLRNESGNSLLFLANEGGTVKISGDYSDPGSFNLSGSEELEEIERLNKRTGEFHSLAREIAAINRDSMKHPDYTSIKLENDLRYKEAYEDLRAFSEDFIERNKTSPVSILALLNQLGPRLYVFHPLNDLDLFLETDSILFSLYPENEAIASLHSKINVMKNQYLSAEKTAGVLDVGDMAPDIELKNPDGELLKLSSGRGKIILLDFWASWCPPCRKENPVLVENYRKYKKKGFDIFQVSLDRSHEDWISAIESDSLEWTHVSDLKYWQSDVVPLFNISSIPANYLLNREGRIIAKNLRGPELALKLEEVFN